MIKINSLFSILSLIILLMGRVVQAKSYQLKILNQTNFKSVELKPTQNREVLIFFAPQCVNCVKQMKEVKCLEEEFEISYIALYGQEAELLKEKMKLGISEPVVLASQELLKDLSLNKKISPQLILRAQGRQIKFIGVTSCEKLKSMSSRIGHN